MLMYCKEEAEYIRKFRENMQKEEEGKPQDNRRGLGMKGDWPHMPPPLILAGESQQDAGPEGSVMTDDSGMGESVSTVGSELSQTNG